MQRMRDGKGADLSKWPFESIPTEVFTIVNRRIHECEWLTYSPRTRFWASESSMSAALLAAPAILAFLSGAFSKIRDRKRFAFVLANLGLLRLNTRPIVTAVALTELTAAALGILSIEAGPMSLLPMAFLLAAFTAILVVKRPNDCGCGLISTGWLAASIRNLSLCALLAASSLQAS
jgi:hypothetical protein